MAHLIITIDGPAASGKSTVAQLLAQRLRASFLDTGAMYRAVTLAAMRADVDMKDEKKLLSVLENSEFHFTAEQGKMSVSTDGVDVTEQLRQPEVTATVRFIASAVKMREKLVQMQRQFAAGQEKIVTEGRDQGTVAFPDADVKLFLTADTAERAKRRRLELGAKGDNATIEQIQNAIEERDKTDSGRAVGPLKAADDAVVIDTTNLSVEQVVERVLEVVKQRCSRKR